jgi:hypothetical protein
MNPPRDATLAVALTENQRLRDLMRELPAPRPDNPSWSQRYIKWWFQHRPDLNLEGFHDTTPGCEKAPA